MNLSSQLVPLHLLEHVLTNVPSRLGNNDAGGPQSLDLAGGVAAAL